MSFSKFSNPIIRHVLSYVGPRTCNKTIILLDKRINNIVNKNDICFRWWVRDLFVYLTEKNLVTNWLGHRHGPQIDLLIVKCDELIECCYIDEEVIEVIDVVVRTFASKFQKIFDKLNEECKSNLWGITDGRVRCPSWRHFIFQKEIVELCKSMNILDSNKSIKIKWFEFIDADVIRRCVRKTINIHGYDMALALFASDSDQVKNKFNKLISGCDNQPSLTKYILNQIVMPYTNSVIHLSGLRSVS